MIKQLTSEEITNIFNQHIIHDFPKNEVRDLRSMLKLKQQAIYQTYGYYENNELLAYAFFAKSLQSNAILLDYFAVVEKYRNQNIGSQFLTDLTHLLKQFVILAEVESVESSPNQQVSRLRQKRIDFYMRNGFKQSSLSLTLFHVHYNIIYFFQSPLTLTDIKFHLDLIYHQFFNDNLINKYIKFD
ncbi:MAG: GNAT family N-acetyltransferase [Beduini sp.]